MWIRAIFWTLLMTCAPLTAQPWDALREVQGRHIKVVDTSGENRKGICDSVTADGITLQAGSQPDRH
jgi:hypothetical protein